MTALFRDNMPTQNYTRSSSMPVIHETTIPVKTPKVLPRLTTDENSEQNSSESSEPSFINECPGNTTCVNLKQINVLLFEIHKLKASQADLTQLNNHFIYTLNQKDRMYLNLLQENNTLKQSQIHFKEMPSTTKNKHSEKLIPIQTNDKTKKNNLAPINLTSSQKIDSKNRIPQSSTQIIGMFRNDQKIKNQTSSILNSNYYDNVMKMSNKSSKHQLLQSSASSYLAMTIERLKEVEHNENIEFIKTLTQSEDFFIQKIKNESDDYLITFNECLRTVLKEYKQLINLIVRVKQFLQTSTEIVNTLYDSNASNKIIDHTCKLLDCERALLFLYNPISDMLDVCSGDITKKGPGKISKSKGIIGKVYTKGEKIKIDDTNLDVRYKKEDEPKDKNQKTKNLLCYPLIDKKGGIFGLIEAINKRDRCFNTDDEELLNVYTEIASAIMTHKMNSEVNVLQLTRLEKIVKYSCDIRAIQEKEKLMEKTEDVLCLLFSSGRAQFVFVENGELIHHTRKFPAVKDLGIISLVIKKKESHGCCRVKRCKYYNSLVDIEASDSMITYPVIHDDECIAVAQVSLTEKINEVTMMPKEQEMKLLSLVGSCIIEWHLDNKEPDSQEEEKEGEEEAEAEGKEGDVVVI